MTDKTKCPKCGNTKKPWFQLCWECTAKEKAKARCEVCEVEVPEGHTLCKTHWAEKREAQKKIRQVSYVKKVKETNFREKFEPKFWHNSSKVRSKSELIICYFLESNNVHFQYETPMEIDGEKMRPDFILTDSKNNMVILEHFGKDDEAYLKRCKLKSMKYEKFCKENPDCYFVHTNEDDMYNLKEKLGSKLNKTSLKKAIWK